MLIKPTTTITGIHMEMSISEAVKIANEGKQATRLRKEIAAMLEGLGFDLKTGERVRDTLAVQLPIKTGKSAREEAADKEDELSKKAIGVRPSKKIGPPKTEQCPWCNRMFSPRGIKIHFASCRKRKAALEDNQQGEGGGALAEEDAAKLKGSLAG
jgi:hypothetical protein